MYDWHVHPRTPPRLIRRASGEAPSTCCSAWRMSGHRHPPGSGRRGPDVGRPFPPPFTLELIAECAVLFVVRARVAHLRLEDGHAVGRAATDAHAREEHEERDDGHREASAAGCRAARPRPEEAGDGRVQEREDAADAGDALDAHGQRAGRSPRRWCSNCTAGAVCRDSAVMAPRASARH